jgi:hypothetical protein
MIGLRPRLLLMLLGMFGVLGLPATAAAHSPGSGCGAASAVSALNQYCEDIPGARGPSTPLPGQPSLAAARPRPILAAVKRSHRGELLELPAADAHVPIPAAHITFSAGTPPWSLIAILAAILLAILLIALHRRRPDAAGPPPQAG